MDDARVIAKLELRDNGVAIKKIVRDVATDDYVKLSSYDNVRQIGAHHRRISMVRLSM